MSEIDLGQEFENNFDCYADMEKDTFNPIDTHLAMTKVKFIEVVSELLIANGAEQCYLKTLPIRGVSNNAVAVCNCDKPKYVLNEAMQELQCMCGNRFKLQTDC